MRAVEVEVGLNAEVRVRDVVRGLGEAFDDDMFDAGMVQDARNLAIGSLDSQKTESVVGEIGLQALCHPFGNTIKCELRERKSEVCEFTEAKEGMPLSIGESLQSLRIGIAKLKGGEQCCNFARDSRREGLVRDVRTCHGLPSGERQLLEAFDGPIEVCVAKFIDLNIEQVSQRRFM